MASRLNLHTQLKEIIGNNNVYFQPPESIKLSYPCIIYSLDDIYIRRADDKEYNKFNRYQITLIHSNPDNEIVEKILQIPMIEYDRTFTTSGLNHYVFTLYY